MIVVRFKMQCRRGRTEHALGLLERIIVPSRALDGVLSFDIGRDIASPGSIIAIEVFKDRASLDRQEALPQVANLMRVLPQLVDVPPEATIYQVSCSQPYARPRL